MSSFNLHQHEIAVEEIHRNLAPSALYEHAILYEKDAHIVRQSRLRGGGEEASQSFCQELCDL
jgi:hypothetical protein